MALIINADMPKACGYCFAYDDEYCQCSLEPSYDAHWSRENHCPILGEIPDKHGRMIDGDALMERMLDLFRHGYVFDEIGIVGLFRIMPTVLERTT